MPVNHKIEYARFVLKYWKNPEINFRAFLGYQTLYGKITLFNAVKDDLTLEEQRNLLLCLGLKHKAIEDFIAADEGFRFILVGNIINKHLHGEAKEIVSGTKHFRAGAKVFLFPQYGGNGHMHIPVYGLPRKSRHKIFVVVRSTMINNIRAKKTFDPKLIKLIDESFYYDGFCNAEVDMVQHAKVMNDLARSESVELFDDEVE